MGPSSDWGPTTTSPTSVPGSGSRGQCQAQESVLITEYVKCKPCEVIACASVDVRVLLVSSVRIFVQDGLHREHPGEGGRREVQEDRPGAQEGWREGVQRGQTAFIR